MIDVLKRLAELDAGNPNVIHEGQGSPELQQLLAMQQKYRGTPYEQQLNKRVANQQWREANGKGSPVDPSGRPVPVLSPEEFEKKNPDFLKTSAAPGTDHQIALRETLDLAECGMMPMPGMGGQSHTPASISMTANSGPELSGMLADIMKLAGVHQVEPAHLGIHPAHDHGHDDVEVISSEPIELDGGDETEIMRSMMDRMNGEMDNDKETAEGMYDNSPNGPEPEQSFDANQYAHQENQPGQGDRMDGNMPRAFATMEEKLMADWKQFMTESSHHHHREISVNGKEVDTDSLEIDGIDMRDYPDFVDAYFSDGEFMDGSEMSQDELDYLRDHHGELLYDKIQDRLYESSQNAAEGRVDQLPTRGADYSKYDTDHLKMMLRPGILHRNEAGFKALIRKELKKREQQDQQGVAEGDGGAKYRVKSVGNDVNPATDERCDYYINPVTDKKVYCKPGQKVSKGDHVNPNTGKVTPKG